MTTLEFQRKLTSADGVVTKYVFRTGLGDIAEMSYINKDDGKDIVCIPTQTLCPMGCLFCHTTDYIGKIDCRDLTSGEMYEGVENVFGDKKLGQRPLLISYMGCGEPIINEQNVIRSMRAISKLPAPLVRFAVATSLPRGCWLRFFGWTQRIASHKLPVKLHISLHYTTDQVRSEWMPRSLEIAPTLEAASFYRALTGNAVEVHYALIEGLNDSEEDASRLGELLAGRGFNVKFLFYNERSAVDAKASSQERLTAFQEAFAQHGIEHEYYVPPGLDIGASCGQFLLDHYTMCQ
jgi:23S rRNA (adenine2503-C2)-methyltransferase